MMHADAEQHAGGVEGADRCCQGCGGVGYYLEAVPYGHPNFGKLLPCACTHAQRAARRTQHLAQMSNLALFAHQTFATFDPDVPGVRRAYLRAHAYASAPSGWLLLWGGYGVGKTHLAAAVGHAVLAQGREVLFAVVPDLLDHLRATFGPSSETDYDQRFELIRGAPLLLLDDLGTESTTPWAREKLFQIINHRANAALPTVITSNRPLDSLDPRIASRLYQHAFDGAVLQIPAADYRQRGFRPAS